MKCATCNCDECEEWGVVLYEGQRLFLCRETVVSCYDLFLQERQDMEPQPVPREVPFVLSHIVCTCNESTQLNATPRYMDGQLMKHPYNPNANACRKCNKYYRWVMRTCWECDDPFVQTFTHPYRCITQPTCWNCLETLSDPLCSHEKCEKLKSEKRFIPEQDLTKREKPDLSTLPDIDW